MKPLEYKMAAAYLGWDPDVDHENPRIFLVHYLIFNDPSSRHRNFHLLLAASYIHDIDFAYQHPDYETVLLAAKLRLLPPMSQERLEEWIRAGMT